MIDTRAALLNLLTARSGLAQHELANRAGISTRTARRHLDALVRAGDVLVAVDGPSRRYRLADHAHPTAPLPPLTEAEVEALSVAALAARPLLAPTPLAGALDAAAEKLRRACLVDVTLFELDTDPVHWSFDGAAGGMPPEVDPALFRTLLRAAREGHAVRADYFTASRQAFTQGRMLGPLGFLVRNGAWLVAAADLDVAVPDASPRVKDFALAGFRGAEPLLDVAVYPPDGFTLAHFARDRFGALDGEVEEIRLLVEPEAVPYFKRKEYNPTQQIEEERPDGRAVVSFEAGGIDAVKAWVLSWGPKVRVLAPGSLLDAVAESHRQAATRYAAPNP